LGAAYPKTGDLQKNNFSQVISDYEFALNMYAKGLYDLTKV